MSLPVPLTERQRADLHAAIRRFGDGDRQRGTQYLREGRVSDIRPTLDQHGETSEFVAQSRGTRLYEVEWFYRGSAGWKNVCSCPLGGDCKHAYAAAMTVLGTMITQSTTPPRQILLAEPPQATALVAQLEKRHGRPLEKKERHFVHELTQLWLRQKDRGTVYEADLIRLGLGDPGFRFKGHYPLFSGWWDAQAPLAAPLDLWQYIALFAEQAGRDLPPLMRPLTDTAPASQRLAARERQQRIAHWVDLFAHDPLATSMEPRMPSLPRAVRLRLAAPKLIWEFRDADTAPWQAAKGPQTRDWFTALAASPAGVDPATLALLQEVQLGRTRPQYWSSTEPQTLRLSEPRTLDLLRWLLSHPALSHLLVDARGEPFPEARVPLYWLGRPLPDQPDEIAFTLVRADGTPAPLELLRLPGTPELALAGSTVFVMPAPLPGHDTRPVAVPREALLTPAATRRLRREGVRIEGLALPEIEVVNLRPRFVCRLGDDDLSDPGALDLLEVSLLAVGPEPGPVRRREPQGWVEQVTPPAQGPRLREFEVATAEAALPLLAELGLHWNPFQDTWRRRVTKSFPEEFAGWVEQARAAGAELECDPALAGLAQPAVRARLEVAVRADDTGSGIDWFDLEIVVHAEDTTLTKREIQLLLKARGRFVKLAGKGWKRLQLDLAPEDTERLAELGLDTEALDGPPERQRFHALQLADERIAGLLPEQHAARVRARAAQLHAIATPPLPAGLTAELRPYQREGFHFLAHLSANGLGGVLADDMGLGKTVQALAWLLHLAAARPERPLRALVVCPKSVAPNWEIETRRFAPSLTTAPLVGQTVPAKAHLVVANYTQLRLAAKALGAETWDAVILDEGQNIKNPQSQTAQTARNLRATHRIALTGTPIENRALDLWSLFAFAMPGLLGTQAAFKRTFNDKTDPGARTRLARRVKHFLLRRTKAQVATDLPPRIEEDLFVELESAQRQLYDAELKRARALLLGVQNEREFGTQRFNILQSLLRLRQICCDPRLVGFEAGKARRTTASADRATTGSAKLNALLDTLAPLIEEGHRVLVFSQFVTLLELVSAELKTRGIAHLTLTGQTENRQALVDRFQSEEGEPVFLLSLKAAGSGLNLTAASYVVLFDPWWNPAVEAQAIDRTHRIGQTEQVIAYRLLARGTIEEKIRQLQHAKAELARSIVQEESLASVMSLADLRFVLGAD
jgi:superfamily II DNA or RNA helicase